MKLWMCRWPNGTVSVVKAADKAEAILVLDEDETATPEMITPWPTGKRFFVTFQAYVGDGGQRAR